MISYEQFENGITSGAKEMASKYKQEIDGEMTADKCLMCLDEVLRDRLDSHMMSCDNDADFGAALELAIIIEFMAQLYDVSVIRCKESE